MYSMTESKVIQQADQAQEFEENPQYFNRNIDPAQVNFQINFISKDVNTFISKLKNTNSNAKYISKPQFDSQNAPLHNKAKNYRIPKFKSQIDHISFNTQSLIQDLSWMNTMKNITQNSKLYQLEKSSILIGSQTSFNNGDESFRKSRSKNINSVSKISSQNVTKDQLQVNSKSLNVNRAKFQRALKNDLPKSVDMFKKNSTNFKISANPYISNINKIYFDNNKKIDFLDEFDDKDTVVNEPQSNRRRKYMKAKVKTELKKQQVKDESFQKLTNKKLFEKIIKLESSFQQLKSQQYRTKNMNSRQNQALFKQNQNKSKSSFNQDYDLKVNTKIGRKYTIDENSKKKIMQIPEKKNTLSRTEQYSQIRRNSIEPSRKISSVSSSQRKISKNKIADKQKISLSKWVSEVWENI